MLTSILGLGADYTSSSQIDTNLSVLVNRNIFGVHHALGKISANLSDFGLGVYTISNMSLMRNIPSDFLGSGQGCMIIRCTWASDGSAVCTLIINMDTGQKFVRPADNVAWVQA